MSEEQLWKYFLDNKVAQSRPFDRDFVWVTLESFNRVKGNFVQEWNIVESGKSYRSMAYLRHIHAAEQGNTVWVHKDTGNIARFFPLGIIHLFADLLPYQLYALVKKKSLASVFARPE